MRTYSRKQTTIGRRISSELALDHEDHKASSLHLKQLDDISISGDEAEEQNPSNYDDVELKTSSAMTTSTMADDDQISTNERSYEKKPRVSKRKQRTSTSKRKYSEHTSEDSDETEGDRSTKSSEDEEYTEKKKKKKTSTTKKSKKKSSSSQKKKKRHQSPTNIDQEESETEQDEKLKAYLEKANKYFAEVDTRKLTRVNEKEEEEHEMKLVSQQILENVSKEMKAVEKAKEIIHKAHKHQEIHEEERRKKLEQAREKEKEESRRREYERYRQSMEGIGVDPISFEEFITKNQDESVLNLAAPQQLGVLEEIDSFFDL
ncbi:hypothetical protein C9374_005147 [Naegleria lovaniensis]|uniref:Uncharacterized protein n=1 Tax=Naegleria lovaniensis TaxID=51637 RepID=A0AA88GQN7_NAELO|nr:uncharacterized protein C9374_005147 [Naegleria lovaniensis]KAG2382567.1 hypothetical protein C9374_005147 [Naegleria lovaniensis]